MAQMIDAFEDNAYVPGGKRTYRWCWYNWPYGWSHFNGIGRITWKLTLPAGKSIDLGYTWHYFWE